MEIKTKTGEVENAMTDVTPNVASSKGALLPFVSIVIPCFNEERFIGKVLENTARQYDAERLEIIVVDGMSTDGTRKVVEGFAQNFAKSTTANEASPRVVIIDNPARNIPAALNLGINAAHGEIIVRMDAHSVPSQNYVRRCIDVLQSGTAEIVGFPCQITQGAGTTEARAIALAVSHPFGIGDAKYRSTNAKTAYVDTVPFGAFKKSLWMQLNGFDEALLANEDYDFYYRARKQGAKVLLDATEFCTYFARPTLADLWTQYARYGRWKAQMLKLHPASLKVRQAVAPLFVLSIIVSLIGGFFWLPLWSLLMLIIALYLAGSGLAAVHAVSKTRRKNYALVPEIMLAFLFIHLAWGGSLLWGLFSAPRAGRTVGQPIGSDKKTHVAGLKTVDD